MLTPSMLRTIIFYRKTLINNLEDIINDNTNQLNKTSTIKELIDYLKDNNNKDKLQLENIN